MARSTRIYPRVLADGSVVYDAKFDAHDGITGKRKQIKRTFKTKREARIWLAQQEADASRGMAVSDGKMTLGQWLDEWLLIHTPTVRPTTEYQYRNVISNHIKPYVGHVALKDVDGRLVLGLYGKLRADGRTDCILTRVHERLEQCLEQARKLRIIPYNPMRDVAKPQYHPDKRDVWARDELERFLSVAGDSAYGPIWRFVLQTGMRNGELRGLRWQDVDIAGRMIHVRQAVSNVGKVRFGLPKDGEERTISVSQGCINMLLAHKVQQNTLRLKNGLRWCDYDLVFPTKYGTPIQPSSLRADFLRMCERANVRPLHIHDMRHTHASMLIASGVEINVVSERLGHSDPAITWRVYAHVLAHRHAEVGDMVDSLLDASQ